MIRKLPDKMYHYHWMKYNHFTSLKKDYDESFKIQTTLVTDEKPKDFSTLREDMASHTGYLFYTFHGTLQRSHVFETGPVLPLIWYGNMVWYMVCILDSHKSPFQGSEHELL